MNGYLVLPPPPLHPQNIKFFIYGVILLKFETQHFGLSRFSTICRCLRTGVCWSNDKCTNWMHQLNVLIKCKWSTTVQSERLFVHSTAHHGEKNSGYSIKYFYGTWDIWHSISTEKNIYFLVSGYSITMMHGTRKNQSHMTITKINIFSFPTTVLL